MATTLPSHVTIDTSGRVRSPASQWHYVLSWVLALSLLFFAARGTFSFLTADTSGFTTRAMGTLSPQERHFGFLGYVLFPALAYGVVMWGIVSYFRGVLAMALQMKTLTLLAGVTICSAVWSQDPVRSAYNGVFYLICTLFAYYLVARFPARDLMTLVMMTGTLVCVIGIVLVIFLPNAAISDQDVRMTGAWRGIFLDRTTAGKCLTFLLSPALVFGRGWSYRKVGYVVLVVTSLLMAHSVTAVIIVVAYGCFMFGLRLLRRLEYRAALLVGFTFICLSVLVAFIAQPLAEIVLAAFGRDLTLTGRTQVWNAIMPSIVHRPLLGYGFYAFWLGMNGESGNVIRATHWFFGYAHNGMLEIVLQLGIFGLVLFLITFFQATKDALICYRDRSVDVDWYIGLLFLTVLYNIDEATVVWPTDLLSMLYVVACCGLSVNARRLKADFRWQHATSPLHTE